MIGRTHDNPTHNIMHDTMTVNAIETYELTRYFDKRVAVDRLTLAVPAGSVFGFLGPNGAGKTTTVRMLSALIDPTYGGARVAGYELGRGNKENRRRVGILTEFPGLYIRLSALENLVFFGGLAGLSRKRVMPLAEKYLRMLDLWDRRDDPVSAYSKGMRQRLAICRALLHEPDLVFLDEPTSGLDPDAAYVVREVIKSLRAEGRTVFMSTHNMPEAEALCDYVGIFATKLLRVGSLYELRGGRYGLGTVVKVRGDVHRWLPVAQRMDFVRDVQAVPGPNGTHPPEWGELAVRLDAPDEHTPALVQGLAAAGAPILYVGPIANTLESIYIELLGHSADAEEVISGREHAGSAIPSIG